MKSLEKNRLLAMKRNYELNELIESQNENFAAKAADLYEYAKPSNSYSSATKLQNSIRQKFASFV
jgi:hypothetical protein